MTTLQTLTDRLAAASASADPASRDPSGCLWADPSLPSCNVPGKSVPVGTDELNSLIRELGGSPVPLQGLRGAKVNQALHGEVLRASRGHAARKTILEILRTRA